MEISFDQWLEELDEPSEFYIPKWMKVGTWIRKVHEGESETNGIITEINVHLDLTEQDGELVVFYKILGHREDFGDPKHWNRSGIIEIELRLSDSEITYQSSGDVVEHQFN